MNKFTIIQVTAKQRKNNFRLIALLLWFLLIANIAGAQISKTSELYLALKAKDSLLFEVGFNNCNLSIFDKLISEDFEFYHDRAGINESKESFMADMKNGLCSTGVNKLRRVLIDSSLEVYPLYNNGELYGAIQMGLHSFDGTTAKFIHLWILENEEWKLSRVLSYNHNDE